MSLNRQQPVKISKPVWGQPKSNPHQGYYQEPPPAPSKSSRQHKYGDDEDSRLSMKNVQKSLPRDKVQSNKPAPISHGATYQPVENGRYQKTEKVSKKLRGSQQEETSTTENYGYGGVHQQPMYSSSTDW